MALHKVSNGTTLLLVKTRSGLTQYIAIQTK
jgi:hypothetical protein